MLGLTGVVLYLVTAESDCFIFYSVCAYVVVYALTLLIGYGLLRKLKLLLSFRRVAANIAAAVGVNILIDFLLFRLYLVSALLFILAVFVLLVFLNFALSKGIFAVSNREARLIGMLTGLIGVLLSLTISPAFFV